jgi:hypothetical protein
MLGWGMTQVDGSLGLHVVPAPQQTGIALIYAAWASAGVSPFLGSETLGAAAGLATPPLRVTLTHPARKTAASHAEDLPIPSGW